MVLEEFLIVEPLPFPELTTRPLLEVAVAKLPEDPETLAVDDESDEARDELNEDWAGDLGDAVEKLLTL